MKNLGYKPLRNFYLQEITPKKAATLNNKTEKTIENRQNTRHRPTKEQYRKMRQQRINENKETGNHQRPAKERYRQMRKKRPESED